MNILFGTGYSAFSAHYFQYIQQLAHLLGARITVVHVYNRPIILSELGEDFDDVPYTEQIRLRDEAVLRLEEERIRSFVGINRNPQFPALGIETIVEAGDVDTTLKLLLDSKEYDFLVLGMRRHDFQDRLLGNLVQRLISQISVPLLLIPPAVKIQPIKNVLYTTAFDIGEENAVKLLLNWTKRMEATISIAHVVASEKNIGASRQSLTLLTSKFTEEFNSGRLSANLLHGELRRALEEFINRSKTHMLVMHHRKRGLLETMLSRNVAKELAEDLAIPMLVLQGEYLS